MKPLQKIKHNTGFTLIETLISILILTLAVTGPIYIASLAFRNTIDSRDNITAQYLAEEVVEVIRNKRDARMLTSADSTKWISDGVGATSITDSANCFNNPGETTNKCIMKRDTDAGDYTFESCYGATCPAISFDANNTNVVYGKTDVSDTSKFTREFYFQRGSRDTSSTAIPDREVQLVVNITWLNKGQPKIYTLTERLYAINYNQFFIQ